MSTPTFVAWCADELGVTMTLPQRVLFGVAVDGVQPQDLTGDERELARTLFGDVDRVREHHRHVFALLKGARMGGTYFCSLSLLWDALHCDLSFLAAGEACFFPIVSERLALARQALRYISGAVESVPRIKRLVTEDTRDALVLTRRDGHEVRFVAWPASRGGAASRGRTIRRGFMDESSFFRDPDTGVVNDSEVYRSMVARVRHGGQLMVVSTAWLESGLLWDLVQENHGRPDTALGAIAPTTLMRPDDPTLLRVVSDERRRDPENAAREFDCVPLGGGSLEFFDRATLRAASTVERVSKAAVTVAGTDLAFRGDSSAIVVVSTDGERIDVVDFLELRPSKGNPLVPSEVVIAFAELAAQHGATRMVADGHYIDSAHEHLRQWNEEGEATCRPRIMLDEAPKGAPGKAETHTAVKVALREQRIHIPDTADVLIRQLGDVVAKPTPGGSLSISSPRRKHSGHGDVASAFVLAAWAALNAPTDGVGFTAGRPSSRWGESTYEDPFQPRGNRYRTRRGF